MIRFFRKIRQQLFTANKFSKYLIYAIGEIALVVIGILIALQINNWNERTKQNAEETRLLEKISKDLISDINQLKGHINDAKNRQLKVDSILDILYHTPNPDAKTFFRLNAQGIAFENHFEVNSGTFDESQAAGSIKFVKNDSLREQIFTYYRITKRNYNDDNTIQTIYRDIYPVMFKKLMVSQDAMLEYKSIPSKLPPLDIESLSKDEDYIAMLLQKEVSEKYQIESWELFIKMAHSLQSNIKTLTP